MKKSIVFILLVSFILSASMLVFPGILSAIESLAAGTVIKGKGIPTLYYVGEDGKRYVFPNDKTYFSWFEDFGNVVELETEELYKYPLGGNARYKPGKLLLKIQTDPRVYAVGANGKLRWIKTEKLAKFFYGNNWNKMIDDVPDSFFTNYQVDEDIDDEEDFNPDEEEEENPTISHNRGWRIKARIKHRITKRQDKRCRYLLNSINRLQKRAERWGFDMPSLGDDYLSECTTNDRPNDEKKVTVCHKRKETISVARSAVKAHIRHGDYLGACDGDSGSSDDDDNNDDNDDNDDDQNDVDETAPVISDITAEASVNSATITWATNEDSDSFVEYATENIIGASETSETSDGTLVSAHSIELTGLEADTTYYYVVKSTDSTTNVTTSDENSFTTEPEADVTAPLITEVSATASDTNAEVTWTTNEEADSLVIYSTSHVSSTTDPGIPATPALLLSHSVNLSSLATSTTYYYMVESADASGNTTRSEENSFTTE